MLNIIKANSAMFIIGIIAIFAYTVITTKIERVIENFDRLDRAMAEIQLSNAVIGNNVAMIKNKLDQYNIEYK